MNGTDHRMPDINSNKEQWRWVVGYEGSYLVSNIGQVKSVDRYIDYGHGPAIRRGRMLTQGDNGRGYLTVGLSKDGSTIKKYVHRLVAEAFIPNEEGKPEVNHKDGNKSNNVVDNLEWVTSSANKIHAYHVIKTMRPNRHLTEDEVIAIRKDNRTQREIADDYGIDQTNVSQIKLGKIYKTFSGVLDVRGVSTRRKLTAQQVREIRASSESIDVLAKRYCVNRSTVHEVRRRTRYKDISDE